MHSSQLLLLSLSFLPLLVLSHGSHDRLPLRNRGHGPAFHRRAGGGTTTTVATLSVPGQTTTTVATATIAAVTTKSKKSKAKGAATLTGTGTVVATPSVDTTFATSSLSTTYAPGATPPVTGAPVLPNYALINEADWPIMDKLPTNLTSPLVAQYVAEVDMSKIPNIPVTGANGCQNTTVNAAAIANAGADGNCWWTCGHCVRDTDITFCPDKGTWGLSYDDGPSPSTPKLLDFLDAKSLLATFFVVGSRALEYPLTLQETYMAGHQLSVHTWAHPSLTTISNEGIIAELAWSKAIIKAITGVTPNTFRPPYGDIDDRVRNIALQMGLTAVIWTTQGPTSYDTQDWEIPEGLVTTDTVMSNFEGIINNSSELDTGFIVLEHDLFEETVDLAVNFVLPQALSHTPTLTLEPIITCLGEPLSQAYVETFVNNSGTALAQNNGLGASTSTKKSSSTGSAKSSSSSSGAKSSEASTPRVVGWGGVVMALGLGVATIGFA